MQITTRGLLPVVAAALSLALAAPAELARAQAAPLSIQVEGALGNDLLGAGTWLPLVVRLHNRTGRTLRGNVRASLDHYGGEQRSAVEQPYVVRPHATESVAVLLPAQSSTGSVRIEAIGTRGDAHGTSSRSFAFRPGASILVVGDREFLPRALAHELFTDPREEYRSDGIATRARPILGVPALSDADDSGRSREMLPPTALAYGGIRLVVTKLAALESASTIEREALLDWVHTGGRLLVLHEPETGLPSWLRAAPDSEADATVGACTLRRLGFGWLSLAAIELPRETESPYPFMESSIGLAIATTLQSDVSPGDAPGMSVGWSSGHPRGPAALDSSVATRLDPNRVSAFWLGIAGLLLVLYVVAVGPLNFKLLARRPALALLTTPVLAGCCALMLLGVGVLHKGVRNRFRRIEIVETTEGSARAVSNRFTAAFFARPSDVELRMTHPRLGTVHRGATDELPTTSRLRGPLQRVDAFPIGTWDTVGLREQGVLPFGRGVTVEAEGTRGVVHNRTDRWLRSAIIVSGPATCRIGDIAPGASRSFSGCRWSRTVELDVERHRQATTDAYAFLRYQMYPHYGAQRRLADALSNDDTTRELLEPLLAQTIGSGSLPMLLARLDADPADPFEGDVAREADVAVLRVVPALPPAGRWMVPTAIAIPPLEDTEVTR